MNGKRKRRVSSIAATTTSSRSESRATEKPLKGRCVTSCSESQPNQIHNAPMKKPHAITEANAKMPAATQRSLRLNACAMP